MYYEKENALPNSNMLEKYQDVCEMLGMDSDCSHKELIEQLEWYINK